MRQYVEGVTSEVAIGAHRAHSTYAAAVSVREEKNSHSNAESSSTNHKANAARTNGSSPGVSKASGNKAFRKPIEKKRT